MQINLQMEGTQSEQGNSSSSDDSQIVLALRKMMKKEIKVMVIRTVEQVIGPFMEGLVRKVVKEEIQSAQAKLATGGNRDHNNEITMPRNLLLKFLDEVSSPVLTGKAIQGKGGNPIRVAIVDKITGRVVRCGPESSAKVEILLLDSSGGDNLRKWNLEDFSARIIREGDKKKPHVAKGNYVCLEEGIGFLQNSRLGHGSNWMRGCKCRLGARIMENLGGINVQEAWTESFMVLDSRSKLYEKHYPPRLSDYIWRLENIGKDGPACKNFNNNNIFTVKDFLFLHSIDPQRLQQIAVGPKWKPKLASCAKWRATVSHARTCNVDDSRIYLYYPSSEFKMGVAFDAVGGLKGVIRDSHYISANSISEADKASAHKLLLSAFLNQKDIAPFVDESSLRQFQYSSHDASAATNSNQEGPSGADLSVSGSNNGYDPMPPGTSSQCMGQTICHVDSLESITMEHPQYPNSEVPYQGPSCFSDLDTVLELFGDNEGLMALIFPDSNMNLSETPVVESHSHQQSNVGSINLLEVVGLMLLMHRARKRFMALGNVRVKKKHRIH